MLFEHLTPDTLTPDIATHTELHVYTPFRFLGVLLLTNVWAPVATIYIWFVVRWYEDAIASTRSMFAAGAPNVGLY